MATNRISDPIKKQFNRVLLLQMSLIALLTVVVTLLKVQQSLSVFIGGLAYWVPTFIFLKWVARYAGAKAMVKFVVAFFMGEMVKLFLSGVLFLLSAKYLSMNVVYGLLGLMGSIIAYWIAAITLSFREGSA